MSLREREVFRLVALRAPDSSLTIKPVNRASRDAQVKSLYQTGSELARVDWVTGTRTGRRKSKDLSPPFTEPELQAKLTWFGTAKEFAKSNETKRQALTRDQIKTLRTHARGPSFQQEVNELTASWLRLELRDRTGRAANPDDRKAHQIALRFVTVMRYLAAGTAVASTINELFTRPVVLPATWRERHTTRLTSKPSTTVDQPTSRPKESSASTGSNDVTTNKQAGKHPVDGLRQWQRDRKRAANDAVLLQQVSIKAVVLRAIPGFHRKRFDKYLESLQERLSPAEKKAYKTLFAGRPPHDFDGLVTDLEQGTDANLVTANELCRRIRVFEEEKNELLPTPSAATAGPRAAIRALGWGDLLVVREEVVGYEAGEISHIENALAGESSSSKHDRRHRTKVLDETETTTDTFTENQFATTDRFELQTEASLAIATGFALQAGVNTSGKYGLTQVDTSVSVEMSRSKQDATRNAENTAHDVVTNAVNRTQETVRSLRRTMTTDTIRDLTRHAIDNTKAAVDDPKPRTEIYRWVNKVERLQMYEYGKRLMIEFTIPEPGVSLIEASQPVKPARRKPLPLSVGPADISEANYLCLTDRYHARDVPPPPPLLMQIGEAFVTEPDPEANFKSASANDETELLVPPGYMPISGRFACTGRGRTQTKGRSERPQYRPGLDARTPGSRRPSSAGLH